MRSCPDFELHHNCGLFTVVYLQFISLNLYIGAKYKDRKSNKYNWSQQLCSSSYVLVDIYSHMVSASLTAPEDV